MAGTYYGGGYMSPEEREQARQEAMREDHQEALRENQHESESYQNLNAALPLSTNFHGFGLNDLKGMVASANPDGVRGVGENWKRVHDQLVGPDGHGLGDCAYGQLKKAVDNVLEHWEGESANRFREQAYKILKNIYNTGQHCETVSLAMKQASDDLRAQKGRVEALQEPSWFDRAWDRLGDSGRDDTYTQEDVRNKNLPKDVIAQINEDHLSEGKEVQLQAVAIMETLGRSYVGYTKRIEGNRNVNEGEGVPPSNPTSPMPAPIPAFSGSSPTPGRSGRKNWSATTSTGAKTPVTTGPRDAGIFGGQQVPVSKTKLDGLPSGIADAPDPVTSGGQTGRSAGPTTSAGPNGPGLVPGTGRLGGPRSGGPGGRSTGPRAGIRGVSGGGGSTGRSTAVGGGIRGGGGGAGGGRGAGSGGRGPLARAKGGIVGAPKGLAGGKPATPGGTGLGKGRGGTSGSGQGTKGGMFAGRMGSNQRPGEDEREEGQRPDYLVEDEETWTPEDNRSVPRTIE